MQTLVLLISTVSTSAFLQRPKVAEKALTVIRHDDDVAKLSNKLEHVIAGLDQVYKVQSEAKNGVSRFGQLLKPYLSEMHQVMTDVKSSKNLTEAQKLAKLHNVEASVNGLKKDMDKLTTTLKAEGEEEKESILLGVLMSRKNKSEKEQMEVLESDDFKNLPVVKYVLAHRVANKTWAEQVAARLDATTQVNHTAVKAMATQTEGIVKQLTGFLHTMEKHLTESEKVHKKITEEHNKVLKENEAKLKTLEGKDKNMINKTVTEEKSKTTRLIKIVKRRQKKEDREYLKQHGMMSKDVTALRAAIEAVKKGDMTQLAKMQAVLQQSMKAMQGNQDFLHFLQLQAWTDHSKACPYCKAQCLEKCHNGGRSFMQCMTECENVGN
eukprot:gnl/MRDRNA2_/MRDRNA2_87606_c0_seq1.p1 gnl/MRDRNA2_/MRDRNA2_87606_c0~~gnl/MRDRNA2_/MRDRNA2_87606_c0_seq1.p1  ORF type:complete len:381 (-),score=126.93 gnl/MRDRNA2_/MRDRNA2_87606_c0_seq1:250-1392(-)